MIKIMITDRISSLPIAIAEKKGFFEELGLDIDLRSCIDYKGIFSLLESGRIDAGELPTLLYVHDCFLKKSKVKRLYKGLYLSHSKLSFYSRNFFEPSDILVNKTFTIPVPSELSIERFFTEKFVENFFPGKMPKLRFVELPYYLMENQLRKATTLGMSGDSNFYPFLNKFQNFEDVENTSNSYENNSIPGSFANTLFVFGGQFVSKFPNESDKILRAIRKAIKYLNEISKNEIDELSTDFNLNHFYPSYRIGEFKQILLANKLDKSRIFSVKGNSNNIHSLIQDFFFRTIKKQISLEEINGILQFDEIWQAIDNTDSSPVRTFSFKNPGADYQYSPTLVNYRKQNYTRHLITDAISISLDILEGNIHSRLNVDETLRIDNRVKIHINNMLDYWNAEIFKLNERIIELENFNSILEIKLDRSSVNLQYSEERYRYLFEFSREALIIVDADSGALLESNLQFRLMSGYSRMDLSRMKIDDLVGGQKLSTSLYFKNERSDSMLHIPDGEIILRDGNRLGVDISINSMLVSPKKRYQIIIKDNRERIESERAKHEFISNISHELRSPMTNIRGYFELLSNDSLIRSKPENSEMLSIIDKNIKRLSFLIENLLKIERNQDESEAESMEEFDPAIVIEDVMHMNSHLSNEKDISITADLERGHLIKGIRFEFSQIVSNLYINAIKYTEHGFVKLSLKSDNKWIRFTVTDSGYGIPDKFKSSVFDRFFRIPSESNRKIGGTGLGLSIVKSLVEKMGAELKFQSEEGKGSSFEVEIQK
ncbi:MAG: PAS domain-containing sensor histidine kinase [Leptospira sp.]|nr:MAG: PAS domain-containing sensor histidine kinase [Leptospira sp.]